MTNITGQRRSLVTGGAGFIGSHLVEQLVARGDHVTVIDDLSTGRVENLSGVDAHKCLLIKATVSQALPRMEPGAFDEVYHLAAAVGVRLVIEAPVHTIETNITETSAVLHYAVMTNTPMLLASTSEVYGKSTRTPMSEDDDVVFGPTIYSRWSYACSKAIDEYLALAYRQSHALPVTIVRFFNTVGPRQVGHYGMVLPRFVDAALAGETLQVHGDGQQTRCFCDVRDVVTVLPAMLRNEQCIGRVFNLGSDSVISIADLAELVVRTLDSQSRIRTIPYDEAFGPDFDDLRARKPDLSRIVETTGFKARIPLEQTIRDIAAERRGAPTSCGE
jgi:UDP-glucose 4-epimerase